MDIVQLRYFINIVECGCNLSLTAKKVHISQSALSQMVHNYEKEENIYLFERRNGRLEKLTAAGEMLYAYAQEICQKYDDMQEMIRREAARKQGTIRIGIPSLILRIFFSEFMPNFFVENPDIRLDIIELGGEDLKKMFLKQELDIVLLIEPSNLNPRQYEEHVIQIDEISAFMSSKHPLSKKKTIKWQDLADYPIGTFNEAYTTHLIVTEQLEKRHIKPKTIFTSASWDYLVETTKKTQIVSVLPSPIRQTIDTKEVVERPFEEYLSFNVVLCRPKKEKYSSVEQTLYESILNYFYQPLNEA